jgi:hypothetical protein
MVIAPGAGPTPIGAHLPIGVLAIPTGLTIPTGATPTLMRPILPMGDMPIPILPTPMEGIPTDNGRLPPGGLLKSRGGAIFPYHDRSFPGLPLPDLPERSISQWIDRLSSSPQAQIPGAVGSQT